MPEGAKYVLTFWFEWGGGCLWAANEAAFREYDLGPLDLRGFCQLPLSPATLERIERMGVWHDTALNWDSPNDPGPWRQPECDRFNRAAEELLADIRRELGPDFEVIDEQPRYAEDPRLDAYLAAEREAQERRARTLAHHKSLRRGESEASGSGDGERPMS